MITTVGTSVALAAALATAQAGDTVLLKAGVYSGVTMNGLSFAQDVTIASADQNAPAVLTNLMVVNSKGLTFSGLEFTVNGAENPFVVRNSQDIHFDHLNAHGSLDGNPQNDNSALLIQNSSDVSVANSEFHELLNAITHIDTTNVTIRANVFHDLRTDGIHGGGSSFITIADNSFRDTYIVTGDHPDAIQFWTTNTTVAAHDITISGNQFIRGAGTVSQGIFMRDEVGGLPFQRVTITNNLIVGGLYHGITVLGGKDIMVTRNVVAGFTDYKSWIMLQDVNGATETDNSANEYVHTNVTGLVSSHNATSALATDGGAAAKALWQSQQGAATTAGADDQALTGGAGADSLDGGAGNDTITDPGGSNYLRGGEGNDSIAGGAGFDDINGNMGNDTASGGLGDDWVVGGKDNDSLSGGAGGDLVYGNLGADTCDGGDGADIVRGGQDDDVLFGGGGDDFLSGDKGADTMTGGAGADIFHTFGDAGVDRVTDFHLSEGDRVQVDPGSSYTLSQVGADTVINLLGGATMVLAGVTLSTLTPGWIFGA